MTLTEFLLARITEDEAVAKAVPGPKWMRGIERTGSPGRYRGIAAELVTLPPAEWPPTFAELGPELARTQMRAVADHIARHDPARVLAGCEAKRQLVESCTMGLAATEEAQLGWEAQGDTALRILAAEYADHADYDATWRP